MRGIRDSRLIGAGGCTILDRFPDATICARLLAESRLCLNGAVATTVATSEDAEFRGGNPARSFISAPGGAEQTALYRDRDTTRFLSEVCNAEVRPTGGSGTYTYYARPGDHLALHRDIDRCDVAVVTSLLDRHADGSSGGETRYYPARSREALSSIRATPQYGAVRIRVPVGSTLVMFGGLVPHLIEPLAAGELRVVSILCYRVRGAELGSPLTESRDVP